MEGASIAYNVLHAERSYFAVGIGFANIFQSKFVFRISNSRDYNLMPHLEIVYVSPVVIKVLLGDVME